MKAALALACLLCAAPRLHAGDAAFEVRAVAPRLGLPGTSEVVLDDGGGDPVKLALGAEVLLDTSALASAEAKSDSGAWFIAVELTAAGREHFGEITTKYQGRRLAILINGQARCAPVVNAPILDGSFEISGEFSEAEVKAFVADLNAAAAKKEPAPAAPAATPGSP